eukprot:TRINITY_DN2818_c0_g1_i1.p3 TRINITY_DN2818_c0_g1~~TRINITY_DN2818_c0_g1_i1.p3  ORF type:complete len:194 (-),score=60.24 TRINITY_DN2818_c0_g1_i1:82-663(-)
MAPRAKAASSTRFRALAGDDDDSDSDADEAPRASEPEPVAPELPAAVAEDVAPEAGCELNGEAVAAEWSTASKAHRRRAAKKAASAEAKDPADGEAATAPPALAPGVRVAVPYADVACEGEQWCRTPVVKDGSDDLYYDQKELFYRSHTRAMKQSRSKEAQRKTAYQMGKRREQSLRDGGTKFAAAFGGDDDF